MSSWLILFVGAIYLYVTLDAFWNERVGLGLTFLGYALGNVGLYWVAVNGS
jgi:hypothetical protein